MHADDKTFHRRDAEYTEKALSRESTDENHGLLAFRDALGLGFGENMPSHEEKLRRKTTRNTLRQTEQDRLRASIPMSSTQMKALFDFVDKKLSESECDDTLRYTIGFLRTQPVEPETVLSWLEKAGGYCDYEVIANAEEKLEFLLHD